MADPLSTSGLVLTVLSTVRSISAIIGNIKNAPYQVQILRSDLEALKPALDQLNEVISGPGQSDISVADHLFPALQQCQDAAQLFQDSLNSWTKRLVDGKLAWLDRVSIATRRQSQIDAFQKQLAACKQSLRLSITATHLSQSQPKTPARDGYYWEQVEVLERNATETGKLFSTDVTRMDDQIRGLMQPRPADNGGTSQEDLPDNAVRQLQLYKAAAEHFHKLCSESIPETVTEVKQQQQRIRNVKTSGDSAAHVGSFNEREGAEKINQDISDVTTDNKSFAIVGTANGIDFNQMFANMRR